MLPPAYALRCEAMFAHIVYYTGAFEVVDCGGGVVGGSRVVVDFGVCVDYCDFDAQVAGKQNAEKETRGTCARDDDLSLSAERN